ncbi:MAG: hypothetical protein R2856_33345 [Caldilineaceae bacterium]
MGGFDKHILAQSKDDIAAEVDRPAPLVEEGGYISFCDHHAAGCVAGELLFLFGEGVQCGGRGLT